MYVRQYFAKFWRTFALILAPLALLPVAFADDSSEEMRCAFVVLLMAAYWMTEALPLPITSLIPMVAFPYLGILSTGEVGINYLKSTNFMFLGGLILALAVEQSGLHQRMALKILLMIGTAPRNLLLGFMLTTAFLSMWISNTATTAMMIPIVEAIAQVSIVDPHTTTEMVEDTQEDEKAPLAAPDEGHEEGSVDTTPMVAIISQKKEKAAEDEEKKSVGKNSLKLSETDRDVAVEKQRNLLLIAVAYSANIGGTGVITGSPPNLVVPQVMQNRFGPDTGLNFASWMAFAIPLMSVNLIISWLWLIFLAWNRNRKAAGQNMSDEDTPEEKKEKQAQISAVMRQRYDALGKITTHELSVLLCFVTVIGLWFFRRPLFMPGWGELFVFSTERGKTVSVGSATPAILMVLVVFALPTHYKFWPFQSMNTPPESSPSLISWKTVETKLPWGVIILLGGGFALSDACEKSGLSKWMVQRLLILVGMPPWLINLIVCAVTVGLTQVASNTATANVLLPILADLSLTICQNPLYLIMASAVTASYAFMLPVATAPNAIVFGASSMTIMDMLSAGFGMNVITLSTTMIAINTYAIPLYHLDVFPTWAVEQLPENITCLAA